MNAPMAGKFVRRDGPGKARNGSMRDARDCHCCGQPPGKWRTLARRATKRSDRSKFRTSIRRYLSK